MDWRPSREPGAVGPARTGAEGETALVPGMADGSGDLAGGKG